jgi:hypothetical protein
MSQATADAPETPVRPLPRRGRWWVVLVLAVGLVGLGYAIVQIATQK